MGERLNNNLAKISQLKLTLNEKLGSKTYGI